MKPSRFTEEQITYALKQAEAGEAVIDVCRRLGISQQTCSQWRRKDHGLGVPVTCPQLLYHPQC